eukprot:COSAG06_NODE_51288_length_313_cov_0.724299_1_plen_62_part_01
MPLFIISTPHHVYVAWLDTDREIDAVTLRAAARWPLLMPLMLSSWLQLLESTHPLQPSSSTA